MSILVENDSQGEYHSIHGPVAADIACLPQGRDVCADLPTIDDRISPSHQHGFDLTHMQDQIIEKSSDGSLIHGVPVEILSLIFILVKEKYDDEYQKPLKFVQPRTSAPLLIGSICKEWREITLQTPHLWTDITVDLGKPTEGQVCMIKEWACRAGALPINLEVLLSGKEWYEHVIPEGRCEAIAQALRPFALRWNDVVLGAPWYFCEELFEDLEESPSIGLLHFSLLDDPYTVLDPIKLRHPLRPKRFHSWNVSGRELPLEWDNLVHLEVCELTDVKILHIIRHAPRLRYCATEPRHLFEYGFGSLLTPATSTHIVHHSLIHFKTTIDIFGHLTLPSLQHLDYCRMSYDPDHYPNSLVDFINRSSPPLETFSLEYELRDEEGDQPCLEKFPGITSLSIRAHLPTSFDPVLHALTKPSAESAFPRLVEFSLHVTSMSPSSWTLVSRLFKKDIQLDNPDLNDMNASVVLGKLLSKVQISVWRDSELMDKNTFLHLLAVKKSGFNLDLKAMPSDGGDLFHKLAERYDAEIFITQSTGNLEALAIWKSFEALDLHVK